MLLHVLIKVDVANTKASHTDIAEKEVMIAFEAARQLARQISPVRKGGTVMARLIGIREASLKPGVSEGDFARFVIDECYPAWWELPADWQVSVLKGVRGDRIGKYIVVDEFESEEARDRHFPPGEPTSEKIQQWLEAHRGLDEKWETFATTIRGVFTDYVEVERDPDVDVVQIDGEAGTVTLG